MIASISHVMGLEPQTIYWLVSNCESRLKAWICIPLRYQVGAEGLLYLQEGGVHALSLQILGAAGSVCCAD